MWLGKALSRRTSLTQPVNIALQEHLERGHRVVIVNPMWSNAFRYSEKYPGQISIYLVDRPSRIGFDHVDCPYKVYSYDKQEDGCIYLAPYATRFPQRQINGLKYDVYYIGGFSMGRYVMALLTKALASFSKKRALVVLYSRSRLVSWLPLVRDRKISWRTNVYLLMHSKATIEYLLSDCRAPSVRWYDAVLNGKLVLTNNYYAATKFDPFMLVSLVRYLIFGNPCAVADGEPPILFDNWLSHFR
jgi:hypothetical protein